ncbi:MAG: diacylglycerol/lipid kinase family protein [Anaerolineales bacterium]
MRQIWVLHNTLAGRPGSATKVERAAEALARRGLNVRLERAPTVAGLRQAARAAVAEDADAALVAGGDGSLGLVAAELAGSPVALGFLPTGTANVWAKEIGLPAQTGRPDALERAALLLLDGRVRLADLGRCNGHHFLLWAGVGLDAFVMHRLAARRQLSRQWGFWYNVAATFNISRDWRGAEMRVAVNEQEAAGHYLLAVVSNVRWHGGGLFRMSPQAQLDDGQMDLWLFAGRTYAEALAHTARVFAGRHHRHPAVRRLTGNNMEIYTPAPQAFQADGEPFAPTERLSIQVVPQALRVLVPAQAPPGLFRDVPS